MFSSFVCNSQIKINFEQMPALAFAFAFEKAMYCTKLSLQSRCVWIVFLRKDFVKTISINLELLTSLSGQSEKSIKITIFIIKQ